MTRTFFISKNSDEKRAIWGPSIELPLNKWLELFGNHERRTSKEGPIFLPGKMASQTRSKRNIVRIDALVYDIDGGQSLEEIDSILSGLNAICVVCSSHSHMKKTTAISPDAIATFVRRTNMGNPDKPATKAIIEAYLKSQKKDHIKITHFDPADPACRGRDSQGVTYIIHHEPLVKVRVIFPLKNPIIMDNLGVTNSKIEAEFKSIYHGVGQALGLKYDEACEDPSRIFYFPSCPPESTPVSDFWGFPPNFDLNNPPDNWEPPLLDYEDYPRAFKKPTNTRVDSNGVDRNITASDFRVTDSEGKIIDLLDWNKKHYDFDIVEFLERALPPEMVRKERTAGGRYVECPFEWESHSDPGTKGENDSGTFADSGNGDFPWTIFCSHTTCSKVHNRTKLDYLAEYIRKGHILVSDILGETTEEELRGQEAANILNVDPKTLPERFRKPTEESSEATETEADAPQEPQDEYAEDVGKSADEVYEECLRAMKVTAKFSEAKRLLDRIKAKGYVIDSADLKEVLARSPMGATIIKKLMKIIVLRIDTADSDEWCKDIKSIRDEISPIEEALNLLNASGVTGAMLNEQKAKLADYYFRTVSEVSQLFAEQEAQIIKNMYDAVTEAHFAYLTKRYAKIKIGASLFYVDIESSAVSGAPQIFSGAALREWNSNKTVEITRQGKNNQLYKEKKQIVPLWMQDQKSIEEFYGVTFVPKGPRVLPGELLNLWSDQYRFGLEPRKGDVSPVLNHIREVWCNEDIELYNWTLVWLADIIQNPENRPMTALLIKGGQGTGKSIIFDYVMEPILVLDRQYGKSSDREHIVGRFNSNLAGKLLWLSEESLFAGDRKSMQILKDRITSPTIFIEKKGLEKFSYPSYTRFVFTSNMMHALHLEDGDRRFVVYQVSDKYKQNTAYFTKMREWCENGGARNFLHFLMEFKPEDVGLTWDCLKAAPKTAAKREQIEMSYEAADSFFVDILKNGRITEGAYALEGQNVSWPLNEEGAINPKTLKDCYFMYLGRCGGVNHDRNKFAGLFRKYFLGGASMRDFEHSTWIEGKTVRVIKLPPRAGAIQDAINKGILINDDLVYARKFPNSHKAETLEVL